MALPLQFGMFLAAAAASASAADPFPASTGDWQWVPITGSKCMNGKETGVYIRYGASGSNKVGIFLNGGGACFNAFTCGTATSGAHPRKPGSRGIFSKDDKNPLKDFTWINVPYCTGDVHLGVNSIQFKGAHRDFSGRANLALMMERAVATFPTVDSLFVTGESAGGFGAAASYDFLRGHWTSANGNANIRGILVDDSGPILDDTAIPPCLQELWRQTWNINASLPVGCPCIGNEGNIGGVWKFMQNKWSKDSFGLVSSMNDVVISTFFSFGLDNCKNPIPIGYNKLAAGLKRLSAAGVPVYMIGGSSHTHTSSNEFFTRSVSNTLLYKWVAQLISTGPDPGSVGDSSFDAPELAITV
jgi:hypothetical protein